MKRFKTIATLTLWTLIALVLLPINVDATTKVAKLEELRTALEKGDSVELTEDINITDQTPGLTIKSSGDITINGNGKTISGNVKKIIEIYAEKELSVTFTNINIVNTNSQGRCIDTRSENIKLTLDKVNLTTTGTSNPQNLTIGGDTKGNTIEVKITNSTINASESGYGIITFNPTNLTIDSSTIKGYSAIYMKENSNNSNVTIQNNSNLISNNVHTGSQNNFGTIVFEDRNINVDITNSTIKAYKHNTAEQIAFLESEYWMSENTTTEPITITIENSEIISDTAIQRGTYIKTSLKNNVVSNIEITADLIDENHIVEKTTDNKYKVVEKFIINVPTIDKTTKVEKVTVSVEKLEETKSILIDSLKDNQDIIEKINNDSAKVEIEIDTLDETTLDKTTINNLQEKAGNAKIATYFDITIAVKNSSDNTTINTLDNLTEEIELMILLPEELKNTNNNVNRTYYIIRQHGNEIEKIKATLSSDGNSLTFKSDKFSTYALAYEDNTVTETKNPETNDNIITYILLLSISIVGLITIIFLKNKRITN